MENKLKNIYKRALKIRLVEEKIVAEYPKREMRSPTHLHIGQEAIPASFCEELNTDDLVYGYYRSHGWYLAKGGNLDRMIAELYGKKTGCSKGFGGSMHLFDPSVGFTGTTAIVAGAMPHAVGGAFALRYQDAKAQRIALCCFGDAATEEGVFQESLMFAALRKIPVIFVCENNGLATNTLIKDRQPDVPIYKRAAGFGVYSVIVDGNNPEQLHDEAIQAVRRARLGQGPSFIECTTYRYLEHCGPNYDFSLGHRTEKEIEEWKKKDPITFLEKRLDKDFIQKCRSEFSSEIESAFIKAKNDPYPTNLLPEGMSCL